MTRIARLAPVLGLMAAAGLLTGCRGSEDSDAKRIHGLQEQKNVTALTKEIDAQDPKISCEAVRALGHLGPQARPQVEKAMQNPRSEIRQEAVAAYPHTASGPAAPALAAAARTDTDAAVRAVAVTSLGRMRALDEMETLLAAVQDADPMVRQRAADAIGRIMGEQYDFGDTDAKRRQTVAEVRKFWRERSPILRQYYQTKPGTPPKAYTP
ncbi:MAG: HEAT repeat domain-containing protein [Planctomycetota bacterium]|nr:HEAT repeat domain-containing protein [Planctomycetota bacterium]